ncbi:MAG: NACHT domain-containing protein [Accumulibacter sp.]|uniref:NACHT domain-containing protein n=1 Tax=Accumulibacter sp. TaxID=2053492 RepID=UPI002FC3DB07
MSENDQPAIDGLRQALAAGFIDAATFEAAVAAIAARANAAAAAARDGQAPPSLGARQAELSGDGAIAQGTGDALGAGASKIGRDAIGVINQTQIVRNYYGNTGCDKAATRLLASQVGAYLAWLQARTQSIELRGIERSGASPVVSLPLATAYVPLRARSLRPPDEEGGEAHLRRSGRHRAVGVADDGGGDPSTGDGSDLALSEVLALGNRLAIIGGPGCGKTTVLLHIAWALASSLLAGEAEPARSRLGLRLAPAELPLPIFVPLAAFARHRRHLPAGALARERTLQHFISHHLISSEAPFELPDDFFVRLLHEGNNVLLLLDGLDEVANEGERAEVRQSVENLVGGRRAMRVVVTCRTIAWRSGGSARAHRGSSTARYWCACC